MTSSLEHSVGFFVEWLGKESIGRVIIGFALRSEMKNNKQ
jgi:hypothetical protein